MGRSKIVEHKGELKPNIHVHLKPEMRQKLEIFSKARAISYIDVIRKALTLLFAIESGEYAKLRAMEAVLDRRFSIPKSIPFPTFYTMLFLFSHKQPDLSCKEFWTEAVYLSRFDRTNKQVWEEINEEITRELEIAKK